MNNQHQEGKLTYRYEVTERLKLLRGINDPTESYRNEEVNDEHLIFPQEFLRITSYQQLVLTSAGHLKRTRLLAGEGNEASVDSDDQAEQKILIQSVTETIVPKLVAEDLKEHIHCIASERHLVIGDVWCQNLLQLYQIQNIQHGLMMVGPSATGKTEAWWVLLAALGGLEGLEGVSYVIDPKAISKDFHYGGLDPSTWEWNNNAKQHWNIFDCDVDPKWVENLNRCGMVWFSEDAVTPDMFYQNHLKSAHYVALDAIEDNSLLIQPHGHRGDSIGEISANLITQGNNTKILAPHFETDGLVTHALNYAASVNHIMEFTIAQTDHSGLDMPPLHKPVDIDTHQVPDSDVVIPTLDTLLELDVVGLNFSSATTPELVLKTFDQHCKYKKTSTGTKVEDFGDHQIRFGSSWSVSSFLEPSWLIILEKHHSSKSMELLTELF
ncbi:hypothetical protein PPACK8108_LOCUS22520 [Phakopsora pachyrhizi]|uniref:Uncharacterized protein n=1 Tax=Phakopsora pachyrhizi TaxID=170000 RepID=A0AAV0BKA4_PHAPC|nr:hypothetical protein PPACK8108_LOCUS22520 [Phakopsora pachyrhizi]